MAITKFLIFPENVSTHSPSPISFDSNCIFLVAQAKNLECLGPGCLSVSHIQNPITCSALRIYSKSDHVSPLPLLSLWSKPLSPLVCIAAEVSKLASCLHPYPPSGFPQYQQDLMSSIILQAPCLPNPGNLSCCSLFIPAHTYLVALALANPLSGMLFPQVAT